MRKKKAVNLVLSLVGPIALIIILTMPIGPLAGGLGILAPWGGIFDSGQGLNEPFEQTIVIDGLEGEVTILIDHFGVPHIYADTAEDAYVGLGFMHAKDRLFQMVIQNRLAAGRVSEIVGAYANSSDKTYRTIGLARTADKCLEWFLENKDTNPDVEYAHNLMNAQVAGINHFINTMTSTTMPIEFKLLGLTPEPWTLRDMFIGASFITWGLTGEFDDLSRLWLRESIQNDTLYDELYPDVMPYTSWVVTEQHNLDLEDYPDAPGGYPAQPVESQNAADEIATINIQKLERLLGAILPIVDPYGLKKTFGSNNWAANGSRTSTGYPILCNDAHMPITAPPLVYEAHISVPGEMNVMGNTLPGMPSIESGFNDYIAWGFTNVGADVLDIFVENLNPANSSEYLYNGGYRPFNVIEETIHTAEGIDIPFLIRESVHGPLIDGVVEASDLNPPNLAMNWTGSSVSHLILAATKLDKAQNLQDYFDAIYYWDNPPFNFAYADIEGNVAMTVCGRLPIRSGYSGLFPITAVNDSIGMLSNIPYAHLPREVNPSRGFVTSTNQRSIDPANYNYTIVGPFAEGYRSRRITELLSSDDNITIEDMMRFQADAVEIRARSIVPAVLSAWNLMGEENDTVEEGIAFLETWDFEMSTELESPTIWVHLFEAIRYEIFDELRFLEEQLSASHMKGVALPSSVYPRAPIVEYLIVGGDSPYFDDKRTDGVVEGLNQILVRALHSTMDVMHDTYGDDTENWAYGLHHTINVEHMAGLATIEGGGIRGQHTLFPSYGWEMSTGPVYRLIANLADSLDSRLVIPGGQSGNPLSAHFSDLFQLWFDYDEVSEHFAYHRLYPYPSLEEFMSADAGEHILERRLNLLPYI